MAALTLALIRAAWVISTGGCRSLPVMSEGLSPMVSQNS